MSSAREELEARIRVDMVVPQFTVIGTRTEMVQEGLLDHQAAPLEEGN